MTLKDLTKLITTMNLIIINLKVILNLIKLIELQKLKKLLKL
jgi:hypothetical protein